MRLRLQRVHFQLGSLKGKIKEFLSFNSLGEMIFWDVDSCQTAEPVKNYQTKIFFIFLNFSQYPAQLPSTAHKWNFYLLERFFLSFNDHVYFFGPKMNPVSSKINHK